MRSTSDLEGVIHGWRGRWKTERDEVSWGQSGGRASWITNGWISGRCMPWGRREEVRRPRRAHSGDETGWRRVLRARGSFTQEVAHSVVFDTGMEKDKDFVQNGFGHWDEDENEQYPRRWTPCAFLWPTMWPVSEAWSCDVCASILKKDERHNSRKAS